METEKYTLRLYIAGKTQKSDKAIGNLEKYCAEELKDQYTVEIIDLATKAVKFVLPAAQGKVGTIAWTLDDQALFVADESKTITRWQLPAADAPATNAITTTTNPPRVAPPPAPSAPPPTKFEIIRSSTIEKPPYPELSQRLGEKGDVILTLTIGIDGKVSDVAIQKSSGFPRLDEAAASWVKGHWRFKPPTQNGQPVDGAKMSLRYQWVLPS